MSRYIEHRLTGNERGQYFSFVREKGAGLTKDYHFRVLRRDGDHILADLFIIGTFQDGCGTVCILRPPCTTKSHPGGHAFKARRISLPVGFDVGWHDPSD